MASYRVVFMGTPDFAVPALEALLDRPTQYQVVAVVTQPDRPAGRGRRLTPSPVKQLAEARALPVLQPTKMKRPETADLLRQLTPDVAVVAAYGRILPPSLLQVPKHGCVNVHASLLPRHRGASPINHAILAGDAESGVSIMQMDEGMDTGPVFATRATAIQPTVTAAQLSETLSALGAKLLAETLPSILDGSLRPQPQDEALVTMAPQLRKEDGQLDFARPAEELGRRVRGLTSWPGTFCQLGPLRVQVLAAVSTAESQGAPGEVLAADKQGVLVACGKGSLRLTEVKPAGKKAMHAAAWVAGRGVAVGDRFLRPLRAAFIDSKR